MISEVLQAHLNLQIDINSQDLETWLKTSKNSPGILKTAQKTLKKMQGKWDSAALYQWFDCEMDVQYGHFRIFKNPTDSINLKLGDAARFLNPARSVMVGSYTVGKNMDIEAANASLNGHMLEAYMIDLIGLIALEKTGEFIKKKAEDKALDLSWGVSPFLSPGSVHGWDLEEQEKMCSLLPLERINITIENNMMLSPLKSMCVLIGIGPNYQSPKVGKTCDVCSKRNNCQMNLEN